MSFENAEKSLRAEFSEINNILRKHNLTEQAERLGELIDNYIQYEERFYNFAKSLNVHVAQTEFPLKFSLTMTNNFIKTFEEMTDEQSKQEIIDNHAKYYIKILAEQVERRIKIPEARPEAENFEQARADFVQLTNTVASRLEKNGFPSKAEHLTKASDEFIKGAVTLYREALQIQPTRNDKLFKTIFSHGNAALLQAIIKTNATYFPLTGTANNEEKRKERESSIMHDCLTDVEKATTMLRENIETAKRHLSGNKNKPDKGTPYTFIA